MNTKLITEHVLSIMQSLQARSHFRTTITPANNQKLLHFTCQRNFVQINLPHKARMKFLEAIKNIIEKLFLWLQINRIDSYNKFTQGGGVHTT